MDSQAITGQRNRRGFNLIEAAIVLGVVGIVLGGLWSAATTYNRSFLINEAIRGFVETEANAQQLISIRDSDLIGYKNIEGLTAPKDWIKGNKVISPLGNFEVRTGPNGQFGLVISFPSWACEQTIFKLGEWGLKLNNGIPMGRGRMWRLQSGSWNNHVSGFPVSLQTAQAVCADPSRTGVMALFHYTRIN
jgi:hypothetical protein